MTITSFQDLTIDFPLVTEFFATFARFEYALKATGFCRPGRFGEAKPDWRRVREEFGAALADYADQEVLDAVGFLVAAPPQIQMYEDGCAIFRPAPLRGDNDEAKAIEAVCRVRNNLFHGGKHNYSQPERDEMLIRCSLVVLRACFDLIQTPNPETNR